MLAVGSQENKMGEHHGAIVRWMAAGFMAGVAYVANIPQPIRTLIVLMLFVNLPFGYIALLRGRMDRKQFWDIGVQKAATLLFLGGCHILEPALQLTDFHLEKAVAYLFIGHEAIAMVRYATAAGVQVPDWLEPYIQRFIAGTEPKPAAAAVPTPDNAKP